ncbi:MAG: 4-hydroxy-3-methylbut-2-enyl diphosphate reductase [Deltaproteobacteria bacterium]|nr:4-hydroxy-3-methylbut-2-enyl diphosphate reductase [Deltaproteobacteria bacterium]
MEILIAKTAGFCFGVKRAINIARKSAEDVSGEIYTLGPIIHNPQVVKKLEESSNIRARNTVGEMDGGTVIIRSHGVKLKEFDAAKAKGLDIVDATCPFVKKTQDLVSELTKEGYTVVVVGDKEHPEVQGIISYGNSGVIVATTAEDLKDMPRKKKIGIVAQTTQSQERLQAIASFCLTKAPEVKVCNTICNATSIRQKESVELSKVVGCMIVVGGKNSANTRRLAEICRSIQPRTYHIETASEIDPEWFEGVERLGVTAGASTPNWIISEAISKLEELASRDTRRAKDSNRN